MEENKDNVNKVTDGTQPEQSPSSEKKPAPEKKLRGRRRLFSDYRYAEVKNKKGKTVRRKVYQGKHYGYVIPKEYKGREAAYIGKIKLIYALFFIVLAAIWFVTSAAVPAQGLGKVVFVKDLPNYTPAETVSSDVAASSDTAASAAALFGEKVNVQHFYVLLPYLVCALPLLLMLMTLVEFIFTKGNKHEQAFMEALTSNLRGQTITLMIAAAVTAVGETVFIISNFRVILSPFAEVGLIALMLCIIGVCIFWLGKQEKYKMEVK